MKTYTVKVFDTKRIEWYLNGKCHREDGPAVICPNGDKYWYLNGQRHRENGPAVVCTNGTKNWYLNGKLHREDGPAIICADGYKYWILNGKQVTKADVMGHTIVIDGKEIKISQESFENFKKSLK